MISRFDHAVLNVKKQFERLEHFRDVLLTHASTAAYLATPTADIAREPQQIRTYHENNGLWEDALRVKRFFPGFPMLLEGFFLFEWFPRSPGLYFTPQGKHARHEAMNGIARVRNGVLVFNPHGKQSMLDGGVGNIRLNPITIAGEDLFLMSASGNGTCHQGFPVGLRPHDYQSCIDEIREKGTACRSLAGKLRVIPAELGEVYAGYVNVPKFYLQVDDFTKPRHGKSRRLEDLDVSVAVSFLGEVEGSKGIYASYVTFDPSRRGDLQRAVEWMGNDYVASYKGKVLTDFDEQENHFVEARFSLKKVMALDLKKKDFNLQAIHGAQQFIQAQQIVKTQYIVQGGNIGALGDDARAVNVKQDAANRRRPAPRNRNPGGRKK